MTIKYTVMILCALGHIEAKATLHVYLDEVVLDVVDPEYFDPEGTELFVTDENTISANWTIVKKFPLETTAALKVLGLSMGQYIQPTGLNYAAPFCNAVRDPIIIGPMLNSMGVTPDNCPPEPANYFQESYEVKMESLPDDFLENKYLITFEIFLKGKTLYSAKLYLEAQNL